MPEHWETFINGRPRAPRSTLEIPLQFRPLGADAWQIGRMQNISRTGLLFTVAELAPLDSKLELSFVLPVVLEDQPPATVICRGNVVRCVPPEKPEARPALAIQIQEYDFVRGDVARNPGLTGA